MSLLHPFLDGARIGLKPLSVNNAYRGRRFSTKEHLRFAEDVSFLLPKIILPEPPYQIEFIFGLSSSNADGDNCIKVVQDVIAKKYGFNDKQIKRWIVDVIKTKKGEEFFEFHLKQHNNENNRL